MSVTNQGSLSRMYLTAGENSDRSSTEIEEAAPNLMDHNEPSFKDLKQWLYMMQNFIFERGCNHSNFAPKLRQGPRNPPIFVPSASSGVETWNLH